MLELILQLSVQATTQEDLLICTTGRAAITAMIQSQTLVMLIHMREGALQAIVAHVEGIQVEVGSNTILIVVTVMVSRHVRIDAGHLIMLAYAGNGWTALKDAA